MNIADLVKEQCQERGISMKDAEKELDVKQFQPPTRETIDIFYGHAELVSDTNLNDFMEALKSTISRIPESEIKSAEIVMYQPCCGECLFEIKTKRLETDEEMRKRWLKEVKR